MIEIVGLTSGSEFEAANHIKNKILQLWPDMGQSKEDVIKIFCGAKLYSYKVQDIDLLIVGSFSKHRHFDAEYKFFPRGNESFIPKNAYIKNFILVIEVKSHDPSGVRFQDKVGFVRYRKTEGFVWEDVTEKNRTQMFEFKKYLGDQKVDNVYVQDLIFFTGLRENDFPARPHNFFGIDSGFERILNILGQISGPKRGESRSAFIEFGAEEDFKKILSPTFPLFKQLDPTPIDRRRMDRIASGSVQEDWVQELGSKQIILKGRGGVGKTVIMLQMAYKAFDRQNKRSLVLTYNKALVADMRRVMALLGVPRSIESGGINIDTVHSFFGRIMYALGITNSEDNFLEAYEEKKDNLLHFLKEGAVTTDDIKKLIAQKPDRFFWDLIFVDEGQDWPQNEIEILKYLYGVEKLIISDGVDQLIRDSIADWPKGTDREILRTRRLTRCLRMKANLAIFVSDMAELLKLENWDLEPNIDANGDRIVIVEGNYFKDYKFHNGFCEEAKNSGNYPIDLLLCVPPSLVDHKNKKSQAAQFLLENNEKVWDGAIQDIRQNFPTDREQLRIVQYDSCRGLEGWTVFNLAFDDMWQYKYNQWSKEPRELGGLFDTKEDMAAAYAAQWCMIPLTRALDTLVIHVSNNPSFIKDILLSVKEKRPDFVEWVKS